MIEFPSLKVDTPVTVWNKLAFGKYKMHFASFNRDGKIETFREGKTSWSGKSTTEWDNYEIFV